MLIKIMKYLVEKYYLLRFKKKVQITQLSLFPFEYKGINYTDMKITPKGKMFFDWCNENPDGTDEEFENIILNYFPNNYK